MTIRAANFTDIPAIVDLGVSAVERSTYGAEVNKDRAREVLYGKILDGGAFWGVFVADRGDRLDGVIVGCVMPSYEVLSVPTLTHEMWYARPDAAPSTGLRLLKVLHKWGTSGGKTRIQHVIGDTLADPERVGRLLERQGLRKTGSLYTKEAD